MIKHLNMIRISSLRAAFPWLFASFGLGLPAILSAVTGYPGMDDTFPFFAPAAGQVGSRAIALNDPAITAWATGYSDLRYGAAVDATWMTPERALGPALGTSTDVVSLGRGGQITLTFNRAITDGAGADFAVFENSFSDTFLELAWVEVSSDGLHYVRFPDFSFTADPVGGFGRVEPTFVHGYAGKYQQGFGTPFDLGELAVAHAAILAGTDHFSTSYREAFLLNYSHLDPTAVNYVRLIDIVGDGSAFDAEGKVIYDPYPTIGSAGFDLDAVAVLHQAEPTGLTQHIYLEPVANQLTRVVEVPLHAVSSSGLPVSLFIDSGPVDATVTELNHLFSAGTQTGTVILRASQAGGESGGVTYAPAESIITSFEIVAPGDPTAPLSFDDWQIQKGVSGAGTKDSDGDGATDFEEYAGDTNPLDASVRPVYAFASDGEAFIMELNLDGRALTRVQVERTADLSSPGNWTSMVPEIEELTSTAPGQMPRRFLRLRLPRDGAQQFWRFILDGR